MTNVCERFALPPCGCPWEDLDRALRAISEEAEPAIVRLRVPFFSLTGPALEKEVAFKYSAGPRMDDGRRPWLLHWEPVGGGPYPEFEGELRIEFGKDGVSPALLVEGRYTPPLGVAGQAFDAVLGSRIAAIT